MTQPGEVAHERRQELPAAKSSALSLPSATSDVTSFRVQVPERAVRDLHSRIRNARWPEKELAPDWSQGVPLSDARDFVDPPMPVNGEIDKQRLIDALVSITQLAERLDQRTIELALRIVPLDWWAAQLVTTTE